MSTCMDFPQGLLRVSKNGQVRKTREGAPLPSEGAGAEMNELGLPRTCRPGRGTDPTKNRDPERHTTQHAGKVEAKGTGGGGRAHGDTKRRASRPTGGGARRGTNHQEREIQHGASGAGSAGLESERGLLRDRAPPGPQTKHKRVCSRPPTRGKRLSAGECCKCSSYSVRDMVKAAAQWH